jgi:tetratricopeptide (TPR) repeat protein
LAAAAANAGSLIAIDVAGLYVSAGERLRSAHGHMRVLQDRVRFGSETAIEQEAARLCMRSRCDREQGRIEQALTAAEQAAALYRRLGQPRSQAFALNSAGLALARRDPFGACRRYRQAAQLLEPHPDDQSHVLLNLAHSLDQLGQQEQAQTFRAAVAARNTSVVSEPGLTASERTGSG